MRPPTAVRELRILSHESSPLPLQQRPPAAAAAAVVVVQMQRTTIQQKTKTIHRHENPFTVPY
jgi:hypothetical protein